MPTFWRREGFPEAWHLRATSSIKACKTTFWCTVMSFFMVGRQEGREYALSLLRRCIRAGQSCNSGPRVVTVSGALKALGLTECKGASTPGTDDVGGPKASQISELRRTAKWHNPPEEDYFLTGEEWRLFQSVAARFNFLAIDRPDLLYSVKELMRKTASPRTQDLHALKRVARHTIKYPRMTSRHPCTQLNHNIEVFGDANFAACHFTRKTTVGGVAMWSGQFVKAWSKTVGVLALSIGESELAAAVRAALKDFSFVWPRGDLVCEAIRVSKRRLVGAAACSFRENSSFQKSGLENPSDAQNKYLGPEPLLRHKKTCNWVPVADDGKS